MTMNCVRPFTIKKVSYAPSKPRDLIKLHAKSKPREFDGGIPPWKKFQKKNLGKQVEATLETVWERTQWPSDDVIASMWDLHRVRREQVIEWFQQRRRNANRKKSSSPGDDDQQDDASWPKTDWDAEWNTERPDM